MSDSLTRPALSALVVTFAMLNQGAREGGFLPGELVAPEDRPVSAPPTSRAIPTAGGAGGSGLAPALSRRHPATDRDYWRWYGTVHIGDREVAP